MKKLKYFGIGIISLFALYGAYATAQTVMRGEDYYMTAMLSKSNDAVAQYQRDRDEAQQVLDDRQARLDNELAYNKNVLCSLVQWKLNNGKDISSESKGKCKGVQTTDF